MKILIPLDGSERSLEALGAVRAQIAGKPSAIYLISVVPDIHGFDLEMSSNDKEAVMDALERSENEMLVRARKELEAMGAPYVKSVVVTGLSPAREIVNFAEKEGVDLIILSSRGRSASQSFILGSVARSVVGYSKCSVYVVKKRA